MNQFDNTDSAFGTVPHDLHRARRRAFQNFFSKQRIAKLEPRIVGIVERFCERLREYDDDSFSGDSRVEEQERKIVPLRDALECLANDIVMDLTLCHNDDNISKKDFNPELHRTIKTVGESGHYMKLVPFGLAQRVLAWVPKRVLVAMVPAMKGVVELQEVSLFLSLGLVPQ